ncbi:CAP domain-containing protein [Microtetraspora niveoalba]|uniref:CAP domain-containing protein n=1 Tax=Microtetraspora niveoalba TaxID=46175 RepID=UPI000834DD26|nr:CAP domain-containing protein [Microtetraspora niveoalba]
MRKTALAILGLGSVAAIGLPAVPANAAAARPDCRVVASKPRTTPSGQIRAAVARTGCADRARVRVRIVKVLPGPDRTVKSGSAVVRNGRLAVSLRCSPGTFVTVVTDGRGHLAKSAKARLTCSPARPGGSGTGTGTGTGTGSGSAVGTDIENEVVRLTNAERAKAGCGALVHDARLRAAAYGHSGDMSAKEYFSHTSQDGRDFAQRIKASGFAFSAAAENIAKGYSTAAAVVKGWMDSPGHRKNMLNCSYTHIGVGHAAAGGPYWTQDFARG